jgi:hypothetical protein
MFCLDGGESEAMSGETVSMDGRAKQLLSAAPPPGPKHAKHSPSTGLF